MTSAQVVKTLVTNNSSFHNYPCPDDHTTWTKELLCLVPTITMHDITSNMFICTYCHCVTWTIVMLTVERTLRRLSFDLCNEVLVIFATWIFNGQYKGSRHGFFDDCTGDSAVSRSKGAFWTWGLLCTQGQENRQAARNLLAGCQGQEEVANGI